MKGRSLFIGVVVAAAALLVGGCSDGDDASPSSSSPRAATTRPEPSSLPGTAWVVQGLTVDGVSVPLEAGSPPTLVFDTTGGVSGSTGCNSYFGSVVFSAGQSLHIDQVAMTEMACLDPPGLMEQESRFASALAGVEFYDVMGDQLTLVDAGGRVTITATPSAFVPNG